MSSKRRGTRRISQSRKVETERGTSEGSDLEAVGERWLGVGWRKRGPRSGLFFLKNRDWMD